MSPFGSSGDYDREYWETHARFERLRSRLARGGGGCVRPKRIDWDAQPLGVQSDHRIAARLGVSASSVRAARQKRGISPVTPVVAENHAWRNAGWADYNARRRAIVEAAERKRALKKDAPALPEGRR